MKKRILAALLAVIALLSLVSCGENPDAETPQIILDYVEKAKYSIGNAASNDTMDFELLARGNSLVYKYTYKTELDEETKNNIVKNSKKVYKKQKDYYKATLTIVQYDCPEVESIIYEYYESNGNLLYSHKIK